VMTGWLSGRLEYAGWLAIPRVEDSSLAPTEKDLPAVVGGRIALGLHADAGSVTMGADRPLSIQMIDR
jgi:hypothetical protein